MVKVRDIAFTSFTAPDLGRMETFLTQFGMTRSALTEGALYMRGTDPDHHVHVTYLGEPGFAGLALEVESEADLEEATSIAGASEVEDITEPGGGRRVRLRDPDGFSVDLVHGIEKLEPLPARKHGGLNTGDTRVRFGERQVIEPGPSRVKRLGHCVFEVSDFAKSYAWYRENLGFIASDEVYVGEESNLAAAFLRCDRGETWVDHHTLFLIQLDSVRFNHAAWEVADFDDLMAGREPLQAAGATHVWGVGRHILGGQIFDYWRDPWGHNVEHWTDGDLFNAASGTSRAPIEQALLTQWGDPAPAEL